MGQKRGSRMTDGVKFKNMHNNAVNYIQVPHKLLEMKIIIGIVNTYFNIMVPGEGVEMIKPTDGVITFC